MSGWAPMPVEWWPFIADAHVRLGEAWPREAVWMDLRWHADRARMKGERMPGRPYFAKRWQWTERRARDVMDDESQWMDERHVQPTSSERPADVQPTSSERPAKQQSNAEHAAKKSSERPADVQPTSSERPADVQALPETNGKTLSFAAPTDTVTDTSTKKKTKVASAVAERRASDIFGEVFSAAFGRTYDWDFSKGASGADARRRKQWAQVARMGEEAGPSDDRFRAAVRLYFGAVKAGTAFPKGTPATSKWFTEQLVEWLQRADRPETLMLVPANDAPDRVEVFIGAWRGLRTSIYEPPMRQWAEATPENRLRLAAVAAVRNAWPRWCDSKNDFQKKQIEDELRNAYRDQLAKDAA